MKRILIAAVMLGLTGGAYAADFGELGVTAAELKARSGVGDSPAMSTFWV